MLTSIAILTLSALLLGSIFKKLKLPSLIGMLLVGIVLGPYVLDILSPNLLNISADLRQVGLIIILTRAGLSLNLNDLKKVGRPAILMSTIPAVLEICGFVLFGHFLFHIAIYDCLIMGAVLGAVSPAVVVPRMLKIQEEGYGQDKGITQLLVASSSVDDVFVIILFTSLLTMSPSGGLDLNIIWQVPTSIILGLIVGGILGFIFVELFKIIHIRDTVKIIILLSVSFLLVALESYIGKYVPFSGLLSIMALGIILFQYNEPCANNLSLRYQKLWVFAEILLFVLVGAEVRINYALSSGGMIICLISLALIFRILGVYISLIKTNLTIKERTFCAIAYIPKATVQAAIGAIPLTMGLACGELVLTTAVLSILFTAPIGAFATDISYKKLLNKNL